MNELFILLYIIINKSSNTLLEQNIKCIVYMNLQQPECTFRSFKY